MRVLLFVFALAGAALAQDLDTTNGKPRVLAVRLEAGERLAVDGRLDEPSWQKAVPATDFMQQDPDLGQPATERTTVRFLFSENSLFMGVECFDSEPQNLMANTMQRDADLGSDDRFMWVFDPFLDGRSGYFFEVNPSGAMGDSLITASQAAGGGNDNEDARAWDGIWHARVRQSETGWTIEVEIPFRTLNFDPGSPAWGVNFQRTVRRKNEESLWTAWSRNLGLRRVSSAGLLEGILGVSQGIGLEIQPYVAGRYTAAPGRDGSSTTKGQMGGELSYAITPQLKGIFTINTDFAETEVDQRLVNLTRFPLFFPERRAFFLEGTTFFDFAREQGSSIMPFFSRQIGLRNGVPQKIEYGAKLTGQVGSYDIGALQVRTANEGLVRGEDFTVLRAKRRFLSQSYAGLIYTRRDERDTGVAASHTAGVDFQLATSRFRGSDNLNFSGYYIWTGSPGVTRDRAAYGLRMEYPNDELDIRMAFREMQPNYAPAVGFVERANIRRWNPDLRYRPRPGNSSLIRRFSFRVDPEWITDLDNRVVTRNLVFGFFGIEFQSEDNFQLTVTPSYERLEEDFEISPGITLPVGGQYNFTRFQVEAETASRRVVSASTSLETGTFFSGRRRDFTLNLAVRPRRGVLVNFENEWSRVSLAEGRFSTRVHRLNANTQFTPWIFVVNNVQYDSVSRILGWQLRFRWIVRPGNDLHFVYAHNWMDNPLGGRSTLDRTAAAKIEYTYRF